MSTENHDPIEVTPVGPVSAEGSSPSVRLGSGTAWAVGMQLVTAVTSIIIGVLVSRALGPEGKGTLSIVQQVVAVLLVLGDVGLGLSAIYYISKGEVRPGTVLGNAIVALLAVSSVAFGAMVVLFRSPLAVVHLSWPFLFAALGLFMVSLGLAWAGAIAVGLRGVRGQAIPAMVAASLTLVVVGVMWITGMRSALVVVLASTAGSLVGVALALRAVRGDLGPIRPSLQTFRRMVRHSTRLYLSSAADFLHFRQDVLMLGWLAGVEAAGVYSVGVSVAEIASRLPSAMGAAIQAQASRVSHESALDFSARAIRLTVIFSAAVVVSLAAVVGWLIPTLFGESFSGAVTVYYLLAPGILANALIWPISSYQSARGVVYWGVSISSVGANAALNLALISMWGYRGAAAASSVSYVLLLTLLLVRLCRDTKRGPAFFLVPTKADAGAVIGSLRSYLGGR